ncbi:MAG: hypothetical protein ACE5HQ_08895 [Gemmatimonadota bacterium]
MRRFEGEPRHERFLDRLPVRLGEEAIGSIVRRELTREALRELMEELARTAPDGEPRRWMPICTPSATRSSGMSRGSRIVSG